MVCPVCPAAGLFGGYFGGYFGVNPPEQLELRLISGMITAGLIVITIVALKCLFGISICDGNGDFSFRNIVQVSVISLVVGVIYSIVVNLLINLWYGDSTKNEVQDESSKPCHCKIKKTNSH